MSRRIKDKLTDLINITSLQGKDGNWNSDGYNLGLFNGLEMALSIFEEREPKFKTLNKQDT
jgi:hypothetical protein